MSYPINWNTDRIFKDGITGTAIHQRLAEITSAIPTFNAAVNAWQLAADAPAFSNFNALLDQYENIQNGISTIMTFAEMISSAESKNQEAGPVLSQAQNLATQFQSGTNQLQKKLVAATDSDFKQLQQAFPVIAFNLQELREQGKRLLDDATEDLINRLAIDGFNGWSQHYTTLSADLKFPVTLNDGQSLTLSAGQAQNRFESDLDPKNREIVFNQWEQTWSNHAANFADTLNHLAGFRLTDYQAHHEDNYLAVPLRLNRMHRETLDAMWASVSANKKPFTTYMAQKARLQGKTEMAWHDQWAPVVVGDFTPTTYTFDQAAEFIISNFRRFSPKMADFAQHAFDNGWIEAEDRPGKRPGGYMTSVPDIKEARIFMTFDGSASGVSTLAHELGHAFHSSLLNDLPSFRRDYAMNVAETASTFAELIVADATVKAAKTPEEKLNLLDAKMSNPMAMLLNIHARYLFERSFYDARQKGPQTVNQLKQLMTQAQETAYAGSLSTFDPMFWADKLHFFIDDVPFYNFPYTFGYLLSSGIYAKAQTQANFEDQYIALLTDTANMSAEDLVQKHLGADLSKPDFWQQGIDLAAEDAKQFLTLSEAYI